MEMFMVRRYICTSIVSNKKSRKTQFPKNFVLRPIVILDGLLQGLMAVASRTEAEGRLVKQRFEQRVEQAAQDLLSDPVADRGDTERTKFSPAFIEELAT